MIKPQFRLDNQLCFRLCTASRLITQAYDPMLAGQGRTCLQYRVLMVLWEKDAQPVNDIAKRLRLETNTVTPLLKRMETEGFLTRSRGREDARQIIVKLTKKGRDLQEKLADVPEAIGSSLLCESVTPETIPGLYAMLDGIIHQLQNKQTNQ